MLRRPKHSKIEVVASKEAEEEDIGTTQVPNNDGLPPGVT
jgi:hypothetical protein